MNDPETDPIPPLNDLIAGEALGDLDAVERQQLAFADDEYASQNASELQRAAAALQLAMSQLDPVTLPQELRVKIANQASEHFDAEQTRHSVRLDRAKSGGNESVAAEFSFRERLSWLVAAASIVAAITFWGSGTQPGVQMTSQLSTVQARALLLETTPDRIEVDWSQGTTPFDEEVRGDVVWSTERQEGYMRFVGMPVNDPKIEQYQLWIIDPKRDDEPIDGGVFDVTDAGEVVVRIDAKLAVVDPSAFAVTIEQPGGVVVSTQERLPLLASVQR